MFWCSLHTFSKLTGDIDRKHLYKVFIWKPQTYVMNGCVCMYVNFILETNEFKLLFFMCFDKRWDRKSSEQTNEWMRRVNNEWRKKEKKIISHSLRFVMSHKWLRDVTHSGTMPTVVQWIIGNLQQTKHARNNFPLTMQFNLIQYRRNLTFAY